MSDGYCPTCGEEITLQGIELEVDDRFVSWGCEECGTIISVTKG